MFSGHIVLKPANEIDQTSKDHKPVVVLCAAVQSGAMVWLVGDSKQYIVPFFIYKNSEELDLTWQIFTIFRDSVKENAHNNRQLETQLLSAGALSHSASSCP